VNISFHFKSYSESHTRLEFFFWTHTDFAPINLALNLLRPMSRLGGSTNPSSCDEGSITCGARRTVRDDQDSIPLTPTLISLWVRVGLKRSDATMWIRDEDISWRLLTVLE
jgi:hypothetical protein